MEPILEFPADLTKKEYIEFSTGTQSKKIRVMYLGLLAVCVALGVYLGVLENWSVESLAIMGASVLCCAFVTLGIPLYSRYKAAKQYDDAVQGGYDFHGTVRFYDDRVEKVCCGDVHTARYSDAAFMENETMMVFLVHGGRALVLPARCLTEADAEAVRAVVRAHLPVQRQLLRHRMTARAAERIAPPVCADLPEEQEVLTFVATHTPKSLAAQARRQASRRFTASMPMTLGLDMVLGLFVGVNYGFIAGVALFAAALAVPWVMQIVASGNRAKRVAEAQGDAGMRFTVRLTDRGVRVTVPDAPDDAFIAWKAVGRAVEGRETVDFYGHGKSVLLSLSVAAVGEHMDALREAVTEQLRRVKGETDG